MNNDKSMGHIVNFDALPAQFPTHKHDAAFWESLGRAVATFGFLEEVLGKAIFVFTATRSYDEAEIDKAYAAWLPKLEKALVDPLGGLIISYGKAVRDHEAATKDHLDALLSELKKASEVRNILCHGSWKLPDATGASVPFFINRQRMIVETSMDFRYIDQVQRHTAELACMVISPVTELGLRFPGSAGPGKAIWDR